ncbi:MAG: S-layer family protein [Nostocaceae cyanobacterium]|nr:S-layer family protein [Nostocaceae cyanobacterium]
MCYSTTLLNLLLNRQKILCLLGFALFIKTPLPTLAQTQINVDGTLPTNINKLNNINNRVYKITGGARPNNAINLFHSFQDFSIQSGDTVRFVHDSGIENIINRVTGGSPSHIDGTIQTLINGSIDNRGNANLFILNPRGIIFGENAKLDIGGSFIGSTADSIKFLDGKEFSATNPADPILTISVPLGLQFGANPHSTISVNGSGNNLELNPNFSLNSSNRPQGLQYQTPKGQTLALIGGNVVLNGGNVTVPQGRVELWSVNQGEVSLVNNNGKLQLQPTPGINYGDIDLINAASVNTSGNSGGSIQVRGRNVTLKDGSVIFTDTVGNGSGGKLNVTATELLQISGTSSTSPIFSSLLADVASGATGNGGDLVVHSNGLLVTHGGQISSGTFGLGNAGALKVKAEDIQVIGISSLGPSGLFAPVAPGARGSGGNLTITTSNLRVTDGAQIFASTFGFGSAGELRIKAENVEVTGATKFGSSLISTSVRKLPIPEPLATQLGAGTGIGGNLIIETQTLKLSNAAQIAASTSGSGKAGNMEIRSNLLELVGFQEFGNVGGKSGLFANAIKEDGQGGDLNVIANKLIIRNGATINASNFPSTDPENLRGSGGTGAAGNININSPFILLENQGTITANTNAGDKGNINIQSQNLQLRQGSAISTNARNSSNGGNINIITDTLAALENSDIMANAQQGFGGRVSISAQAIFGTQVRNLLTPDSDITATSELGAQFDGIVELNSPEVDPNSGLVDMEQDVVDVSSLIGSGCDPSNKNKFSLVGRGGLPPIPSATIGSDTVLVDLGQENYTREITETASSLTLKTQQSQIPPTIAHKTPLIEAQGWIIGSDGKVTLTANVPVATVQNPWLKTPHCSSSQISLVSSPQLRFTELGEFPQGIVKNMPSPN